MPLTPQEEARLQAAFEQAVQEAIREGQANGLRMALESQALAVFGQELTEAASFVEENGYEAGLRLIAAAAQEAWPERWRSALTPILTAIMRAATEPKAELLGSFSLQNPRMNDWFEGYIVPLSGNLAGTSAEKVTQAIQGVQEAGESVPEASTRVRGLSDEIGQSRAKLIARTELNRSSNGASYLQARESGVVKGKTWLSADDSRVRPEHRALDGQTVGVEETFPNGLEHPSEVNCRCTLTYEVDFDALEV